MRHGNSCPNSCSQCLGAAARVVTQHGVDIAVDGVVERPFIPPLNNQYQKRGGRKARR